MNNSVVLITGALTGIGRATALAFAKVGARLVVSGRHDEAGNTLAAELRDMGLKPSSSAPMSATRTRCRA
jgi:NAD(P)-dependent dehydrogenase (short-subunit alcohol dehydrogenase family)